MERPWLPPRSAFHFLTGILILCLTAISLGDGVVAAETQRHKFTPDDYINQRCTFCHSRILAIVFLKRRVENHGIAEVDAFLARHHLPDAEPREVIIRYLQSVKQ